MQLPIGLYWYFNVVLHGVSHRAIGKSTCWYKDDRVFDSSVDEFHLSKEWIKNLASLVF